MVFQASDQLDDAHFDVVDVVDGREARVAQRAAQVVEYLPRAVARLARLVTVGREHLGVPGDNLGRRDRGAVDVRQVRDMAGF
jgi:hypothetical protein